MKLKILKNKIIKKPLLLFTFLIILILGVIFMCKQPIIIPYNQEGFVSARCPTTMIKDGDKILLYNPKFAKIPGVNPLEMKNIQEYKEYVKWQRESKINCPILHLEKVYDTQGNELLEIRPSFDDGVVQAGALNHRLPQIPATPKLGNLLDAGQDIPPFNKNQYPSYDKNNQYVGIKTPLDH